MASAACARSSRTRRTARASTTRTSANGADIHRCLDSTLNVVSYELKYTADVIRDYGAPPEIERVRSQLNRVFTNLRVNAAEAIDRSARHDHRASESDEATEATGA